MFYVKDTAGDSFVTAAQTIGTFIDHPAFELQLGLAPAGTLCNYYLQTGVKLIIWRKLS